MNESLLDEVEYSYLREVDYQVNGSSNEIKSQNEVAIL